MIIIIFIDYEFIAKMSPVLYGVIILLLIGVLFTEQINETTRWFDLGFFSFQPAEVAKIIVILFLSFIIVKLQNKDRDEINKFWKLALAVAVVAVPVLLIYKQPDLGTAILFVFVLALILYVSRNTKKIYFYCNTGGCSCSSFSIFVCIARLCKRQDKCIFKSTD